MISSKPAYHKVGGRLSQFKQAWESLSSDEWVLQAVSGYKIEFICEPIQTKIPNKMGFSKTEESSIDVEIDKLLNKGAIRRACFHSNQFLSNLFTIPKKSGELRPVINLKPLNKFVQYHHFKMESLASLLDLISCGDFLTSIDLKDAYFTIPIHQEHYKYLRFEWKSNLFEFICLPFGLSSAPRVFTKVMKPIVADLRNRGIKLVIYLDDLAIISESHEMGLANSKVVVNVLESLGFIVNLEKSSLTPSQEILYLGFVINSANMTVSLPMGKMDKLISQVSLLYNKTFCTIHDLAHVIGLIVSSFPAIQPAKLYYRELESLKQRALHENEGNYGAPICLTAPARNELNWFISKSKQFNGSCFVKPSKSITLTTDASLSGWGVVCGGQSTNGVWSQEEKTQHINCLELMAIWFGVQCFIDSHDCYIKVFCDNTSAVSYINNLGGRASSLHEIARKIWEWCFDHQCTIEAFHLPGKLNCQADSLSREHNPNLEWMLEPGVFLRVTDVFFEPNLDLFASRLNHQTAAYVSWKPDPGAKAIDAFSLDWHNLRAYMFPPFSLLGKVLAKLKAEAVSEAIVVAPWWPTAHWYPLLLQLVAAQPVLLPRWKHLLILPQDRDKVHPLQQSLRLAAWYVSGLDSKVEEFLLKQQSTCSNPGAQELRSSTQQLGHVFVAGVRRDRQIRFRLL